MGSRFLLAIVFSQLFGEGYTFLLNGCHRLPLTAFMQSFDFSSTKGWDDFYKGPAKYDSMASQDGSSTAETVTATTEWHPSVSLENISSIVPPNGRCLIIGCGNSNLPDVILKQRDRPPPRSVVLLDTSQTCLDQLRERHLQMEGSSTNGDGHGSKVSFESTDVEYVCGDVTQLSTYFDVTSVNNSVEHDGRQNDNGGAFFDMIIDKGLTDALLCGEGWDGPLEKLMCESAQILSKETGQYLLISYELPSSTKRFLVDVGNEVGLKWDFDFDLVASVSQDVNVAMATNGNAPHDQHQ